jgi:signal transduction histidine kinase
MAIPGSDATNDHRVLILAPAGKDGPLAHEVLARHGLPAVVCADVDVLCQHWADGAGLLLVAEEALFPRGLDVLLAHVAEQPTWSDIPVLVFLSGAATGAAIDRLRALRNVSVLERPIRVPALVSTVNAGLRARRHQYEVRDLMSELREANRAKDDFLAMVSHELRTPLNVIRGVSQTLVQHLAESPRVSAAATTIDRNAAMLARLVEDLLDLSRLQKRRVQLNVEPVDLVQIVETAIDMNRFAAEAKGVTVASEFQPVSSPVLGDTMRLQQVVSNLVSNAIKFTPATGTIHVRLDVRNAHVEITVADTGEGISADFLPHVFEPFRQGGSGPHHGGLGLGLAIVRQFVELHGGSISARSDGYGHGATFTVLLPLSSATSALTA